jgi:hypothetical protein
MIYTFLLPSYLSLIPPLLFLSSLCAVYETHKKKNERWVALRKQRQIVAGENNERGGITL